MKDPKLNIDHRWLEWRPKRGPYKNKVKIICIATSPSKDPFLGQPAIIAGVTKYGKLHMHLGSITPHQYQENTFPLEDEELINRLEEKFYIYKKESERKRLIKTAKGLLFK